LMSSFMPDRSVHSKNHCYAYEQTKLWIIEDSKSMR
jgi:hypothetical protein